MASPGFTPGEKSAKADVSKTFGKKKDRTGTDSKRMKLWGLRKKPLLAQAMLFKSQAFHVFRVQEPFAALQATVPSYVIYLCHAPEFVHPRDQRPANPEVQSFAPLVACAISGPHRKRGGKPKCSGKPHDERVVSTMDSIYSSLCVDAKTRTNH